MASQAHVREERKVQILDAALTVFGRHGLHQSRMSDIAQEAGLSKGALYWYFDSKEDLIISLLDQLIARQLQTLEGVLHAEGSVEERLISFTRSEFAYLEAQALPWAVSYEIYAWALRHEKSRSSLRAYFDQAHDILTEFVRQGIEHGEFRTMDPEEAALQLIALNEGLQELHALYKEQIDWDEFMMQAMQTAIDSLK